MLFRSTRTIDTKAAEKQAKLQRAAGGNVVIAKSGAEAPVLAMIISPPAARCSLGCFLAAFVSMVLVIAIGADFWARCCVGMLVVSEGVFFFALLEDEVTRSFGGADGSEVCFCCCFCCYCCCSTWSLGPTSGISTSIGAWSCGSGCSGTTGGLS